MMRSYLDLLIGAAVLVLVVAAILWLAGAIR